MGGAFRLRKKRQIGNTPTRLTFFRQRILGMPAYNPTPHYCCTFEEGDGGKVSTPLYSVARIDGLLSISFSGESTLTETHHTPISPKKKASKNIARARGLFE